MGKFQNIKPQSIKNNRREKRFQNYRKIDFEIYPQSAVNYPIVLEGYSGKLFIGGTCVVLDTKDVNISKSITSFNKTIKNSMVKMSFPSEGLELKITGKIAWTQEVLFRGRIALALGIKFQGLSPKLRGMLFVFAGSLDDI